MANSTIPLSQRPGYRKQYRRRPDVKARTAEYQKRYREENKENLRQKSKAYQSQPTIRERKRAYKRSLEYKAANAENARQWRSCNKEKIRGYRLKARAKREAEYAAIAGRKKPAICDICAKAIGNIVYDHCHRGGHFRGFLCDRCNTVLGLAEDDPSLFLAMASYLNRTRNGTMRQFTLPGI